MQESFGLSASPKPSTSRDFSSSSGASLQNVLAILPSTSYNTSVSQSVANDSPRSKTDASSSHGNPEWLGNLKRNFKEEIIDVCSLEVRHAVEENISFDSKNLKKKRETRMAIKSSIVKKLAEVFGGVSRPSLKNIRELVTVLQTIYPSMFRDEETFGYGLGGVNGNEAFAKQIKDALCKVDGLSSKARVKESMPGASKEEVEAAVKASKKKPVYGVNKFNYYAEAPNREEAASKIIVANGKDLDFSEREKIYEENRKALQAEFVSSKKLLSNVCRGFWKDPRHVYNHFVFVTGSSTSVSNTVETNYSKQVENLELYVKHVSKDLEFKEKMVEIERKCEIDFQGSSIYKDIMIMRFAGDLLDSSGAALVRLEENGPVVSPSPHVFTIQVDK